MSEGAADQKRHARRFEKRERIDVEGQQRISGHRDVPVFTGSVTRRALRIDGNLQHQERRPSRERTIRSGIETL